ncbi:MAG TPA: YlbF family regulator, partial [Opitutales bacterium]|nr:YlbF family regulator [Opitutales bacterium]
KSCAEWNEFHRINEIFENDQEITAMLGEYRQLAGQIQEAHTNGEQTGHQLRQLEHLQIRIQQNHLFQQRENAADAMLGLLQQANLVLTNDLGLDFAANAKPQESGCCGGNGNGGGCGCG